MRDNAGVSLQILSEYLHGGLVTYPPGTTFGPRVLRDYELVWIIDGEVVYHYNGHSVETPPGSVVLCRPGFRDAFTWDVTRPTRHGFAHLAIDEAPEDFPPIDDWPVHRVMPDADIVRPLFRYILATLGPVLGPRIRPDPMILRALETMLGAFITGRVEQVYEHDQAYPDPVARALEMIQQTVARNPSASVSLDDLAASASVSREHLCRLFRETLDVTPMEALRLARLDLAMQLLGRTNLNIEQVADRTGFTSPYHFSRRFKDAFGNPPTYWRKRLAEGFAPPVSKLVRPG